MYLQKLGPSWGRKSVKYDLERCNLSQSPPSFISPQDKRSAANQPCTEWILWHLAKPVTFLCCLSVILSIVMEHWPIQIIFSFFPTYLFLIIWEFHWRYPDHTHFTDFSGLFPHLWPSLTSPKKQVQSALCILTEAWSHWQWSAS